MINEELAHKFVDRIVQYTEYNINIMNEFGYIIASTDQERIGRFHNVAYSIMKGEKDSVEIFDKDETSGVRAGINMAIITGGKRTGVVGITGNPDQVRPIAQIIKMAIEVMLKYEEQLMKQQKKLDYKKRFFDLLLGREHTDEARLRHMAEQLDYREDSVRVPVLLILKDKNSEQFVNLLAQEPSYKNDIFYAVDKKRVILFQLTSEENLMNFREYFENQVSEKNAYFQKRGIEFQAIVGSFQSQFSDYYYGFRHCKWMEENEKLTKEESVAFFYDWIDEYMRIDGKIEERFSAFRYFDQLFDDELKKNYVEMIGILIRTNWNYAEAARKLFMHKNTLIYRFTKLKESLNMDPMSDARDRAFMIAFYYYLFMKKKIK